jgi:hypothetical protein
VVGFFGEPAARTRAIWQLSSRNPPHAVQTGAFRCTLGGKGTLDENREGCRAVQAEGHARRLQRSTLPSDGAVCSIVPKLCRTGSTAGHRWWRDERIESVAASENARQRVRTRRLPNPSSEWPADNPHAPAHQAETDHIVHPRKISLARMRDHLHRSNFHDPMTVTFHGFTVAGREFRQCTRYERNSHARPGSSAPTREPRREDVDVCSSGSARKTAHERVRGGARCGRYLRRRRALMTWGRNRSWFGEPISRRADN